MTFSGVTAVFVEVKEAVKSAWIRLHKLLPKAMVGRRLALGTCILLDVVGHTACDWDNSKDISMPIFDILCNGVTFEFQLLPKFSRGRFSVGRQEKFPPTHFNMKRAVVAFAPSPRLSLMCFSWPTLREDSTNRISSGRAPGIIL